MQVEYGESYITTYCSYLYHIQCVRGLKNTDFLRRLTFCQKIQQQSALDSQFYNYILFIDEAVFTRDGIF